MSLETQVYLLVHTILYGMFIGISFDTMEIFRRQISIGFLRNLMLVIFWILQMPLIVVYFFQISGGMFQTYLVIFLMLGAYVYFKCLRNTYLKKLDELGECLENIETFLIRLLNALFRPMVFIFRLVSGIIGVPRKIFFKIYVKFMKNWITRKRRRELSQGAEFEGD